jgi:hypothetical protein
VKLGRSGPVLLYHSMHSSTAMQSPADASVD